MPASMSVCVLYYLTQPTHDIKPLTIQAPSPSDAPVYTTHTITHSGTWRNWRFKCAPAWSSASAGTIVWGRGNL